VHYPHGWPPRERLPRALVDAINIWDEVPDWGGIGARRLARAGNGLGASIWEIHPGGDYWRHFHYASDELLIVLRGQPTTRTPDGTRRLNEGDVLPLPHGPQGDRSITNETADVVRVLMISTNVDPEVAEYPDSGKVGIWIGEQGRFFRDADAVEHAGPE
jgi:uncharacterized cupin superfamily protein